MILCDDFVFVHYPKTGGTFVTDVLSRVFAALGKSFVDTNKHGTCAEIPPAYAGVPMCSCIRNPYDVKVSQFKFEEWITKAPPEGLVEAKKRFHHFPALSFQEFLQAIDLMSPAYLRNVAINPFAASLGQHTHRFMRTFFRDYQETVKNLDEAFVARAPLQEHMYPVRFFRTHRLNQDLHAFLLERGYPREHIDFILTERKILPKGGTRKEGDHWSRFYTPELMAWVRRRERLIFRLFPEFDETAQPAQPPESPPPPKRTPARNCIILGTGRSGSSMVAGCLRDSGYYMGQGLKGPTESNPLGYFESVEVNDINEDLLKAVLRPLPRWLPASWLSGQLGKDQHWLARVPVSRRIPCPLPLAQRIDAAVSHGPFCFKDPRFSYTLPVWRPFLDNVVFVCVFREPGRTINSMLTDCRTQPYLRTLTISRHMALHVWLLMYRHILEVHQRQGQWLFLHYDQVLEGDGLNRLEAALGATVDRSFPRPEMKRSTDDGAAPREAQEIYQTLCRLAGYG